MVDDDKQLFAQAISDFGVVHRVPVTKQMLRAYWDALSEMPRTDFEVAVNHLRKHAIWLPKPAEFWAASKRGWM